MEIKKVDLSELYPGLGSASGRGVLTAYIHDIDQPEIMMKQRPAIVVFPGGGYGMVSERESEAVAMPFYAAGYNAFVLKYSVAPTHYPVQLHEATAAVHYVRSNATTFGVNPDNVATIGFSAGGHLAGHQAVMSKTDEIINVFGDSVNLMPDACILSYPVISSGIHRHEGSFINLSGGEYDIAQFSLENLVPDGMCPCYLWHCANDGAVDVRNSFAFCSALREKQIPFALRVYEKGGHGGSLGTMEVCNDSFPTDMRSWMTDVLGWLEYHRGFKLVK